MRDLTDMKKDMYRLRRFQMYVVFIRIFFTIFALVLVVMSIIHCIGNGDIGALLLKLLAITVAYIINVFAYHKAMSGMEERYQALKQHIDEKEKEVRPTPAPATKNDDSDENND